MTSTTQAPSAALRHLLERLDLTPAGTDLFVDPGAREPLHRIFGGQVAAQALVAMGRTVDRGRPVRSLHVQFLRPARSGPPLRLHVRRVTDGRPCDVRQVAVMQNGKDVLIASAAFSVGSSAGVSADEDGGAACPAQVPSSAPVLPPRWEEQFAGRRHRLSVLWAQPRPVDIRFVDPPMLDPELARRPRTSMQTLVRADGPLPDDSLLHAGVLVYASDATLLETALLPVGRVYADGDFDAASLDHVMWFHRRPRADRWLRFDQDAVALTGDRGLARGRMVDGDGEIAVTVMQEGALRPTDGRGSWLAGPADDPEGEERR